MRGTAPGPSLFAWAATIVSLALVVAILAADTAALKVGAGTLNAEWAWAIFPLSYGQIGGLIARRHPRNPVGWILLSIGIALGCAWAAGGLGALPQAGSLRPWAIWVANETQSLIYPCGGLVAGLLLLPEGRLPSARWRPLMVAGGVVTGIWMLLQALVPGQLEGPSGAGPEFRNPTSLHLFAFVSRTASWLPNVTFLLGGAILLISTAAPLIRAFRARGEEREQVRWIAYVVVLTAAANGVTAGLFIVTPALNDPLNSILIGVNLLGFGVALPVATAVAIFKYRLYDIDLIISRTLVFGSLAVFITVVYIGVAVGIGDLVGSGGQPNLALSILATAIVAVGFEPLRERLQRLANRLVYGPRATPYEVLSDFAERVAGSYAAADVLPRMARILAEATGAARAVVWLRSGDLLWPDATWPLDDGVEPVPAALTGQLMPVIPDVDSAVAVRHHGELLGALTLRKRTGEALSALEKNLLDNLAGQAGLVLRNLMLTADLVHRLAELEGSRRRLLAAEDAERRRIERELQQGAGRNLTALREGLGRTRVLAGTDPGRARELVAGLMAEADEALQAMRELARGIYPPLLADRGLGAAMEAQLRRMPATTSLEAGSIGRYPREVEAGVYFCLLEALANVQRHAAATHVVVRLTACPGRLAFEVADDGRGFDPGTAGHGGGLTNIADRVDALEGELRVESELGRGARLAGSLPVPVPEPVEA